MIEFLIQETQLRGAERIRLKMLTMSLICILIPIVFRTIFMFLSQEFYAGELMNWMPNFTYILFLIILLVSVRLNRSFQVISLCYLLVTYCLIPYVLYWDNSFISVSYFHLFIFSTINLFILGPRGIYLTLIEVTTLILLHLYVIHPEHLFPVGGTAEGFVKQYYLEHAFMAFFVLLHLWYYIRINTRYIAQIESQQNTQDLKIDSKNQSEKID